MLAGCSHAPDAVSPSVTPTTSSKPLVLVVTIESAPPETQTGRAVDVEWHLEAPNGSTAQTLHTGLHYHNASHPTPTPDAYAYEVGTRQNASLNASYTARLTHDVNETLYLRAHATAEGREYWSDEVRLVVAAPAPPTYEVKIRPGTVGSSSSFMDPDPLQIPVGAYVQWSNLDDVGHTATSDNGTFDTGNVAGGETSAKIQFLQPGTFVYHCARHPFTMTGFEVVVAGSE